MIIFLPLQGIKAFRKSFSSHILTRSLLKTDDTFIVKWPGNIKSREVRFTLTTQSYKQHTQTTTDHGGGDDVVRPSATAQLKCHHEARELLL